MRISNLLPLICAGAMCAGISVRADDNAAQAAARAALVQKMQDLDTQGEPAQPPPAEMSPTNPPPTAPSEPSLPPPPPTATPSDLQPTAPPPAETQPTTIPASPESQPPAPPQMSDDQKAMAEEEALVASQKTNAPTMTPAPATNANSNAPQQLVNMEPAAPGAPIAPTPAPVPADARKLKTQPARQNMNFGFAPIQAPPAPVSPDQEAQLQALLDKYKADQITPDEYQAQRAAIIGPR